MDVRVVTMRYSEGLQGFPEEPLRKAALGREVLDFSEHYFVYANVPHLTLVLKLGGVASAGTGWSGLPRDRPDLEEGLADEDKKLFRELKQWRNAKAKEEGRPAYAIGRNTLMLDIVKARPATLAALKEIAGVGEAMVSSYGKDILDVVASNPVSAKESEA